MPIDRLHRWQNNHASSLDLLLAKDKCKIQQQIKKRNRARRAFIAKDINTFANSCKHICKMLERLKIVD